jgi:hypothetical protein
VCCDRQVHFLYQFSLQFFLDIFAAVLYSNPSLESVKEYDKRLAIITSDLFNVSIFECETNLFSSLAMALHLRMLYSCVTGHLQACGKGYAASG